MSRISFSDIHDSDLDVEADFDGVMRLGRAALAAGDLKKAREHFERAHVVGHNNLAQHVEVHRALLLLAWKMTRPLLIAGEVHSLIALRLLRSFRRR
jgi:hypothetical protein